MSVFPSNGSGNPLLKGDAWEGQNVFGNFAKDMARSTTMSIQGTALKTFALLAVVAATAITVWVIRESLGSALYLTTIGGSLLGCVLVMICGFAPKASAWLALPIALCEGTLAGGASVIYSSWAAAKTGIVGALGTGIVLQAVLLTFGIAGAMLIAYATGLIKVTEKFRMIVGAAIAGICLVSLASLVLGLFNIRIPYIWESGIVGIGFAAFVVVTASLTLALDFDRIENGARSGLAKHFEWFASIALLVTLVWLYISILRLLAVLANRK